MTSQSIVEAAFDLGSADILTFFREQEGWWVLLPLGIPAVAHMILVSAVTISLRRRLNDKVPTFLLAVAVTVLIFASVMAVYQNVAFYFRFLPPGSGLERQDRTYAFWATVGVWVVYALNLGLAGGVGYMMMRSRRWAAWTMAAVALFFVLSLPYVHFVSQCMIGQGLGLPWISC